MTAHTAARYPLLSVLSVVAVMMRHSLRAGLAAVLLVRPAASQVQTDYERQEIQRMVAGHQAFQRRDYAAAVAEWSTVRPQASTMTRGTMYRFGVALYHLGQANDARYKLMAALTNRPDRNWDASGGSGSIVSGAHFHLGKIAEDAGQWDEALAEYELAGRYAPARLAAALLLVERRADPRAAIREVNVGLEVMDSDDPNQAVARNILAVAWHRVGRQEQAAGRTAEAIAAYRQALEYRPGWDVATASLAALAPGDPVALRPLLPEWLAAVSRGDSTRVAQMLRANSALARAADPFGSTGLHLARSTSVVDLLLAAGADLEARDEDGRSAILRALSRDSSERIVRRLLAAGADVRARDRSGRSALHYALGRFDAGPAVVAALITAGAPLEERAAGWTPLMHAVAPCRPDYVRRLKAAGASLDTLATMGTLLTFAMSNGRDCVGTLLELGANPNGTEYPGGATPLYRAADRRDPAMVALLLARGADPRLALSSGMTPLHVGDTASILLLLERGADVNAAPAGGGGTTPLHMAAHEVDSARARVLVTRGANRAALDRQGRTPLDLARQRLGQSDSTRFSPALRNRLLELLAVPAPTARPQDD